MREALSEAGVASHLHAFEFNDSIHESFVLHFGFVDVEGEVERMPIPTRLRDLVVDVAASDARFGGIRSFEPPVGGTDAAAFLAQGWSAVALTCIDPDLGAAGNYHQPSDGPDALDLDQVLFAIDFAEAIARRLIDERATRK